MDCKVFSNSKKEESWETLKIVYHVHTHSFFQPVLEVDLHLEDKDDGIWP